MAEKTQILITVSGGVAYLDEQLRQLIMISFANKSSVSEDLVGSEKKVDRPLSSFSSRINLAYCLGLINKKVSSDLHLIRKIRNRFAHKLHNYSWDEPEVISWCKSLKHAKMIADANPNIAKTHGELFVLGVVRLVSWLGLELAKKNK